jgi:DNA-directed RNA polymerase subunit RPC12/RpoP
MKHKLNTQQIEDCIAALRLQNIGSYYPNGKSIPKGPHLNHLMTPYEKIIFEHIQKNKKDCKLEGIIMKSGHPDFFIPSSHEWIEAKHGLFTPKEAAKIIVLKEQKLPITILTLEGSYLFHIEITKIESLTKNDLIKNLTCHSKCSFEYDLSKTRKPPYRCPICNSRFMNKIAKNYLKWINQKFPVTPVGTTG